MLPVFKPLLPTAQDLLPLLARIDAKRYYTNYGPLVVEFEARLAAACGAVPDQIVTSSNCTMALAQALRARIMHDEGEKNDDGDAAHAPAQALCIVPAWTFVATPAAALLAGLQPWFADVSASTWALDPDHVAALAARLRAAGKTVAAVLPVAPFGARLDVAAWEAFEASTGIAVVIDAAASFDAVTGGGNAPAADISTIPVVVSMHATKTFGIGEGGFVLSSDTALIKRIRRYGNFGFHGSREATVPGWNAKLGELYAAVGLALFDQWPTVRAEWHSLTEQFCDLAQTLAPHAQVPGFMTTGNISTYGMLQLRQPRADLADIIAQMSRHGIETRQWWARGCHVQTAYQHCGREALPHTETLADTVLGLPFWRGMDVADMARAMRVLREVLAAQG